jgi:PKD repeat protein
MLNEGARVIAVFALLLFLGNGPVTSLENPVETDGKGRPLHQSGVIAVKFKRALAGLAKPGFAVQTGVPSLDVICARYRVTALDRMIRQSRLPLKANLPDLSRIYRVSFPGEQNINEVVKAFTGDPHTEYAEPIPCRYPDDTPNDALFMQLQHLPQIFAEQAWALHKGELGDSMVVVAVVDAGTEWFHPDLAENIWQNKGEDADLDGRTMEFNGTRWVLDPGDLNGVDNDGNGHTDDLIGWDVYGNDNDPNTGESHGTHVAGIAAGVTDNGTGIASISWNVKVMPISSWNGSFLPNAYDGVVYAAENGAHIINNSWGSTAYSRVEEEVIAYVHGLGAIIVASAGNDNNGLPHFPSGHPHVISVASVGADDRRATYSSYGMAVDISAPGGMLSLMNDGGILSAGRNGTYIREQGTSMSSPLVAGLLGLIKSYRPAWDNNRVLRQLLATADDISSLNSLPLGAGRINAFRALSETTATLQQALRLELIPGPQYFNIPYIRTLSPGDTASFQFRIRNHAHLVSTNNATFTLTTTDSALQILNPIAADSIVADGYSQVEHIFRVRVSPTALSHASSLTLEVGGDVPVALGSRLDLNVFVSGAGVFVWEPFPEARDFSGRFIADLLTSKGVPVVYSNSFPTSLEGFTAAFLSYGTAGSYLRLFDDSMATAVQTYLEGGGNVYLEGSGSLTADQDDNPALVGLFGLTGLNVGTSTKSPPSAIAGQPNALTTGMAFNASNQTAFRYIGRFNPTGTAVAAFAEAGYGTVAVQHAGSSGQKTFYSSYALAELADKDTLSNRYGLFLKIARFFGLQVDLDYMVADFRSAVVTGHAPLPVSFFDGTVSNLPVTSWEWDFQNDGMADVTAQHPSHIYTSPGTYAVKLRSGGGGAFSERTRKDFVHVFDGNSSLTFDGSNSFVDVPASASLNVTGAFTLEAWIHPLGWGEASVGFGRIVNKNNLLLFLESGGMLVVDIDHSDGSSSRTNTLLGSVTLNNWQHIATTYSGSASDLKIYINGSPQVLNAPDKISGPVVSDPSSPLVIGNNSARTRTFDGMIDELRIWNIARTLPEIQGAMYDTLRGNEPGLGANWRFDEGSGSQVADRSSNGNNGSQQAAQWRQGWISPVTSIPEVAAGIPSEFILAQNFPNPFNPTTTIRYGLPGKSDARLTVFNTLGQQVAVLVDEEQEAGYHEVKLDGTRLSSGVYFYRLRAQNLVETKRCLLLR